VFGEFDFEFAMAAIMVVGQKELHHCQEHKAFFSAVSLNVLIAPNFSWR